MKVDFRTFESSFKKWDVLFGEAAAFASSLRPEQVISISHSHSGDHNKGVVTVWFWTDVPSKVQSPFSPA